MGLRAKRRETIVNALQTGAPLLGTPDYLAPELLFGVGNGAEVDYWAFGVCMYEFIVGIPCFSDESPDQIFKNILDYSRSAPGSGAIFFTTEIEWPDVEEMSGEARDLITQLLKADARQRMKIGGIKERMVLV